VAEADEVFGEVTHGTFIRDAHLVEFFVDGELVRATPRPPAYPMQMMVAVFDFPDKAASAPPDHVPELAVDWVRGGA
jgi:hypothetical protein